MVWEAVKKTAWNIYRQITNHYWNKLERQFKENPNYKTAKKIRQAAFADLIVDLYTNDERSLWMLFQDPKVRKYIKMEMEDLTSSFINTLKEKGADSKIISMMVPEYQLQLYDYNHETSYYVPQKYSSELEIPSHDDMKTEFEAYEVFAKQNYGQSSKGDKRPINSSDDSGNETEVSNTPKKIKPADTTTKKPEQDLSLIEEENEGEKSQPIMDVDQRAGGASNPSGHHGTFHGNTQINKIWEKNRWEREFIHSENEKTVTSYWGMSTWKSDFQLDDKPFATNYSIATGTKTGLVLMDEGYANKNMGHPYNTDTYAAFSDLVYAQPINLYVRNFFDYKTLNSTGGRLRYYNRIILESITVDITIHTKAGGFNTNEWYLRKMLTTQQEIDRIKQTYKDFTWAPRYFVHRDAEGDYSTNGLIKLNSEYTDAATEQLPSLKIKSLKKKDKTSTVVSNKFSFTREVSSGGPYFLTPEKLFSLRDRSISTLINEIEGQSADASGNLQKWPEFFNLLIAPLNSDMITFHIDNTNGSGVAITPNFHTEFHIKCSAKWSARDNSQVTPTIGVRIKDDPFYTMNEDLKQEITHQINTH